MKRGDLNGLATIVTSQRCINEVIDLHDTGERVHVDACMIPDLRARRGREDSLNVDPLEAELEAEALREEGNEGLGRPADRHAKLWSQTCD